MVPGYSAYRIALCFAYICIGPGDDLAPLVALMQMILSGHTLHDEPSQLVAR